MEKLERVQRRDTKWSKGWEAQHMRNSSENWIYSDLRTEGSMDSLSADSTVKEEGKPPFYEEILEKDKYTSYSWGDSS